MSGIVRAALRSKRSHGLAVRCFFSTDAEQPPPPPPPPFFETNHSGLAYGRLFGIHKHTLKTDIVNFFDGCNLTMEDVKMDYNRSFFPVATLLQFPTRDSFDNAVRVIVRKGRLYKLERADHSQWDQVKPFDGKTILIQGMPLSASFQDVGRILAGFEFDSNSINLFLRSGEGGVGAEPIKLATVRFNSRIQAMNAYIQLNGTYCLNNRISIQVIQ